jgi:hypothetical protein
MATTIRQIQTAIDNATRAGNQDAVVRLTQILEKAKAAGAPEGDMPWGEVAGRALTNIPSSAGKYASDIATAVMNPIDTADALLDVTAGGISRGIEGVTGLDIFPENEATAKADAVGGFYKDRYGSMEGFKRALAEDPVGVAADLSLPVTGAGGIAARAPGMTGRVGRTVATIGRNMDPVSLAATTARGGGRAVAGLGGWASGVGDAPLAAAFDARRAGGVRQDTFLEQMRNPAAAVTDVVEEAGRNLDAFETNLGNNYRQGIQSTRQSTAQVDWTPIRNAVNDIELSLTTAGGRFYGGEAARRTINRIRNLIYDYRTNPSLQTPAALDALKQEISDMQITMGPGVQRSTAQANRAATSTADAIRQEIIRLDPNYETTMRDYARGKELSEEIQRSLSLNDRASTDTTLRKLQSTMRNNVQTNYGARSQLLDQIDPRGTLRAALAGQSLNTWAPRGIARAGGAAAIPAAAAYLLSNPGMVAGTALALPLAMPRVVGEVAGLLGAGRRQIDNLPAPVRRTAAEVTSPRNRYAAQEAGGIANEVDAMLEDANGNVYDRKGRLIRRAR